MYIVKKDSKLSRWCTLKIQQPLQYFEALIGRPGLFSNQAFWSVNCYSKSYSKGKTGSNQHIKNPLKVSFLSITKEKGGKKRKDTHLILWQQFRFQTWSTNAVQWAQRWFQAKGLKQKATQGHERRTVTLKTELWLASTVSEMHWKKHLLWKQPIGWLKDTFIFPLWQDFTTRSALLASGWEEQHDESPFTTEGMFQIHLN